MFPVPTRRDALDRLTQFVPKAGAAYAAGRNTDAGPGKPGAVSRLSPYVRYRLITEQDIAAHVLARHSLPAAEKFVQEVFWRTYWKGWLEMRPGVWRRFLAERDAKRDALSGLPDLVRAEEGRTGIDCFDAWAQELARTGYLHNHARMWFASIWIFTLRLPWTLGADFFLRHLVDADPASNTLSWRWVAGLQTAGKTYLATADNIARYTDGRFSPKGLAREAAALNEPAIEPAGRLPAPRQPDAGEPALLLVTPEDLNPESLGPGCAAICGVVAVADRNWVWGDGADRFVRLGTEDAAARAAGHFSCGANVHDTLEPAILVAAARAQNVRQIVTPYAPVGPVADALARLTPQLARDGIALCQVRRRWDEQLWPHAMRGFFAFKTQIPAQLEADGLI
jgi:deoxyribodipyrimidine photo-lyase